MHKEYQETQHDECLICFTPLLKDISFVHLMNHYPLCIHCLNQFEILHWDINFHHYPLHILYQYNEFFRSLLFQYKGLYDHALKNAFLCLYQEQFQQKYHDYVIVVAPSSEEENAIRGFAPVQTIAETFSTHIFTGLYKTEKYKQSQLGYEERQTVQKKIAIKDGELLKGKKVLIFDDVLTSGSTLLTCLSLVLSQQPDSVELLVLATRKRLEELKFASDYNSS